MANKELVRPGLCHHLRKEIPSIKKKLKERVIVPSYKELRRFFFIYFSSNLLNLSYLKKKIFL